MTTRMLIDARHREETRVAVIKGNRIEEFDFESAEHKQLKGNIYLAKVTRVEPSLQAAFIEYGGNRHGFLAFSEIHPDYYQIPKEDREALLREEAEHAAAAAMRADEDMDALDGEIDDMAPPAALGDEDQHDDEREDGDHDHDDHHGADGGDGDRADEARHDDDAAEADAHGGAGAADDLDEEGRGRDEDRGRRDRGGRRRGGRDGARGGRERGGRDRDEEPADFRRSLHRRYKIQDVIRRRQVLLVQVVKEERGTKGAALTTYLSLAGRYCVLMPNSSHGGGISRKISNGADRKRLKSVIDELGLPATMGCIVRTAGLERTKTEIKRDFDYLARLWDEIRENTLGSEAPALIHSDSDLIKRAIRDIYNSEIEEVSVEGDDGYRAAKDFMKLLMPSHARRVKQYADPVSLFQRYGVEDQLGAMYHPVVGLKSGGYLVINPTEALVSIDINSGRSTREHNIEQTALNTNLEAAYEIARQLRLRDMAGLVVIDFIDMENGSNVRKVERAMKDALKNDRARIQIGRISGFGLMEMSRQRLRTGVLEASTRACPHCEGTGLVRTASSAGLSALRMLEEEAARGRGSRLVLRASLEATLYVLNNKRRELDAIESRYSVGIEVQSDGQMEGARMSVDVSGPPPANPVRYDRIVEEEEEAEGAIPDFDEEEEEAAPGRAQDGERRERSDEGGERKRRRGRRRRGRGDDRSDDRGEHGSGAQRGREPRDGDGNGDGEDAPMVDADAGGDDAPLRDRGDEPREDGETRRRRRGRRGGRNRRGGEQVEHDREQDGAATDAEAAEPSSEAEPLDPATVHAEPDAVSPPADEDAAPPARKPGRRRKGAIADAEQAEAAPPPDTADAPEAAPKRRRARKTDATDAGAEAAPAAAGSTEAGDAPSKPKRASRARKAAEAPPADPVASMPADMPADGGVDPVTAPAGNNADGIVADEPPARAADADAPQAATGDDAGAPGGAEQGSGDTADRRRGWWQRTFG